MAGTDSTVLPSPQFPQAFEDLVNYEIRRVERILAPYELNRCVWETIESSRGACDGGERCRSVATVHELASGHEYCARHFAEVSRG